MIWLRKQVTSRAFGTGGRALAHPQLREHGIVAADNLKPQEARVLTMLALARTAEPERFPRMFDDY